MNALKNTGYSLSLYGLYWALRAASWWPAFRRMLAENDLTLAIKTQDGAVARAFTLRSGKVASRSGDASGPDLALTWRSADACFRVLSRAAFLKPTALFDAILDGDLQVEGDAAKAYRFMQTLMQLAGALPVEKIFQWRKA